MPGSIVCSSGISRRVAALSGLAAHRQQHQFAGRESRGLLLRARDQFSQLQLPATDIHGKTAIRGDQAFAGLEHRPRGAVCLITAPFWSSIAPIGITSTARRAARSRARS